MRLRNRKYWLSVALFSLGILGLVCDSSRAQEESAEKTFIVIGSGESVPGDESAGRQAAVADALSAAVGRAVQTMLSPEQFEQRFKDLDALVLSQPEKFVTRHKVLSRSGGDRQHRVLMEATVSIGRINQELAAYGVLETEQKIPTILVLVTEQNIDDYAPRFWWGTQKTGIGAVATESMFKALDARGLKVMDSKQARARGDIEWKRFNKAELTFREAAELGSLLGADLVVVGNSLAVPSSAEVGADLQAMKGSVSAHVIDARSAEEIGKISQTALGMHADEVEAGIEALSNAGRLAGQALAGKIVRAWQTQSRGAARIEVRVEGTRNLIHFVKFRRTLRALDGVEKVQIREMGTDTAVLEVDYKGSGEDLAAVLREQDLGSFGIELLEVTAAGIKLVLTAG